MSAPAVNVIVARELRNLAAKVTCPTMSRAQIAGVLAEQADVLVDFEIKEKAA